MTVDEAIRELISSRATLADLRTAAEAGGLRSLREEGERLVAARRTTQAEAKRVVEGAG